MDWLAALAAVALAAWLYLLLGRDGFWRARPRIEDEAPPTPGSWPAVVAIVPARNEAAHVEAALRSLLAQDYPGDLAVVLVDDHSEDATAAVGRRVAAGQARPLAVIGARPLPLGWSGKLWAVAEGLRHAAQIRPGAAHILLTDADIAHPPGSLTRLVAKAEAERLDLVSLMVRLRCETFWERLLIPPFVFFFQKLYPFPWVNDRARRMAGAAGGCMLVRREALDRAGGIAAVKDALIDDCALAALIKRNGAIWLGLAERTVSVRRYPRIADVWRMVARTAYTQLRHSPWLVLGTMLGMALLYLVPPLAMVLGLATGAWIAAGLGAAAFALMLVAYRPTWALYRGNDPLIALLPLAALLYTAMTVDSMRRHLLGKGGAWKGRTYARPTARAGK
jgi:hopene-associated glycosyltransferase HpnB